MMTTQFAILPIRESALEVIRQMCAPISFAVSAISATVFVLPEPLRRSR